MLKHFIVVAMVAVLTSIGLTTIYAQSDGLTSSSKLSLNPEHSVNDSGANAPRVVSPEVKAEARRLYKEGVKYGRAALFKQAAEIFERVVKLDPSYADAYYSLGHAYFDLRQWPKAQQALQQAIKLNPKDRVARDRLSTVREILQRETAKTTTEDPPEKQEPVGVLVSLNSSTPLGTEANADHAPLKKIYRVGAGDVLDVRLSEASAATSTLFTVSPSGLLEHPGLTDPMLVAGLTTEEIARRLEEDQKRRALDENPRVVVGVRDYASHTILVSGLVQEPGTKILRREAIPLYVVLADAQPLPEAAVATVIRSESEAHVVDLSQPDQITQLILPGDVITVQANPTRFFYVGGEVKSPGEKTYRRGMTLTQAIIAAGGVTKSSKEARLARDDGSGYLIVSRFKLKEINAGKTADPLIQPGDRITIVD